MKTFAVAPKPWIPLQIWVQVTVCLDMDQNHLWDLYWYPNTLRIMMYWNPKSVRTTSLRKWMAMVANWIQSILCHIKPVQIQNLEDEVQGKKTNCNWPKNYAIFFSRCNNRLRRPSSDEISTPTSLRSRSSSLLSSDYIAEENEESNVGVVADNACLPLLPPPTFKGSANNSSSRRTSSSSHSSVGSKNSHEMANDIDRLVKLVHELKEEDLKSYKRKIAERESSKNRHRGSSEESTSESLPPPTLDLQKVLVPTTTRIINAIPHLEPSEMPSKTCPIVLELANASLDLMLTPDSKIYSKASSASDLSNPENPMWVQSLTYVSSRIDVKPTFHFGY